jgi:hypothetical protein
MAAGAKRGWSMGITTRLNLRTKDGSMSHHFHDASNTCEQEKYMI